MSRTLTSSIEHSDQEQQQQQCFYLNNQTPIFLHQTDLKVNYNPNDIQKCKQLIQSLSDNQIKTNANIQQIQQLISEDTTLDKGMGYFAAKNMVFLQYIMMLKLYEMFKINGKSLTQGNGLQLYKRLAYLKTLLLKLAPVEKKLQYQMNKILKHAEKAVIMKEKKQLQSDQQKQNDQQNLQGDQEILVEEDQNENDNQEENEMNFKPRPSALMNIKKQKDLKLQRNDKYEAPKISSNLSKQDKIKQRFQKQKQRKKLGLIRRLQSDLVDGDHAQEKYLGDEINKKLRKKFHEKTTFEEDNMMRLPDNKKQKFYKKQMIRNSLRKNQLEEDFKEVQMVRKLFDDENQMGRKIVSQRKVKNIHKAQKGNHQKGHMSHGFKKKNSIQFTCWIQQKKQFSCCKEQEQWQIQKIKKMI